MNDYTFGNFLCELRIQKGLTQAQLGELLGVTNKAVSKWENGSAKPSTKLIPKIADIFGITVEELFACKRFEAVSEQEDIHRYLCAQKQKFAILSSVFLSVLVMLPLLLVEFICVVMGFRLPDDVLGPLGAAGFLLAFVIAFTAYVIYRKNHKNAWMPQDFVCSPSLVAIIKKGLLYSAVAWWCIFILLFSVYVLIL